MFAVSAAQFTAVNTADVFIGKYITLWGFPVTPLSDDALHFTWKLARAVYDGLGANKANTGACHPCTNGASTTSWPICSPWSATNNKTTGTYCSRTFLRPKTTP